MASTSAQELEEGSVLSLDFAKLSKVAATGEGLLPVAVQDADTKDVILIAYTNERAFDYTVTTGQAAFWSTSRNELWIKGQSSGNTFTAEKILVNCEQNSLVYIVSPVSGGICHTRNQAGKPRDCFYRVLDRDTLSLSKIDP